MRIYGIENSYKIKVGCPNLGSPQLWAKFDFPLLPKKLLSLPSFSVNLNNAYKNNYKIL